MESVLRRVGRLVRRKPSEVHAPYVIVGLGNPGREYARNRHNVGFRCIEELASAHGIALKSRRFRALWGEGEINGRRVVLLQPQTFMNESGQAVGEAVRWFKVPLERILVIHDDLDLPFGKIRVRPDGSSGGHKGIASIIAHLGGHEFARLRIGIGRPAQGDPIDYVLGDLDHEQVSAIQQVIAVAAQAVGHWLEHGVGSAMNVYNRNASA